MRPIPSFSWDSKISNPTKQLKRRAVVLASREDGEMILIWVPVPPESERCLRSFIPAIYQERYTVAVIAHPDITTEKIKEIAASVRATYQDD